MNWINQPTAELNQETKFAAEQRQQVLTKPAGSLGQLEQLAIRLAAMQGNELPQIDKIYISVFAADHGIAAEGVSAYPQAVTAQMIANFLAGGAAISVTAKALDATLEIVNLGTVEELPDAFLMLTETSSNALHQAVLGKGTLSFLNQPAMTSEQLQQAFNEGKLAAERALASKNQLFIGGEMGIGNTTAATALACALLEKPASTVAGPGTGVTPEGVVYKSEVIEKAITHHKDSLIDGVSIMRCLGGFEIAALCGAYVRCAQLGLPILVDGFICSVAALFAQAINQGSRDWMIFAHQSAEPGHKIILDSLDAKPLLQLGMRLGEGSGAAIAVPLIKTACSLHNNMATFAEAGVDDKG